MTRDDLERDIRAALDALTEEDISGLGRDDDLSEAIGLDSLGRLELLAEIEERFDLTISDIDSEDAATIAGMIDLVEAAILQENGVS